MTEVYYGMLNKVDDDSPAKCRQRRRRRMEMRRLSGSAGSHAGREDENESKRFRAAEAMHVASWSTSSGEEAEAPAPEVTATSEAIHEPVFGTMSVSGRSREMEDAIDVQTGLCLPEICQRRPVHFFGVFDGHGGSHVAALCSMKMHVLLEEELMRVESTADGECGSGECQTDRSESKLREHWTEVMKRTFRRMDDVAVNTCACGSVGSLCGCHPMEVALAGSTAVVAALTPEHIVIANCGDSRAVLCKGGRAIPVSRDHKPDRTDELARIEAAGGRVIYVNGARVEGILAMSRAIGDKYLKPFVSSEPEITVMERDPRDDCLIIATDGLWDVLTNEMACEVACKCLEDVGATNIDLNCGPQTEEEQGNAIYPSRSVLAAALLTRLALGRKSLDNISVIVIDLKKS